MTMIAAQKDNRVIVNSMFLQTFENPPNLVICGSNSIEIAVHYGFSLLRHLFSGFNTEP